MESVVKQKKDKTKINKTFLSIFKLFFGRFNKIIYYPKFINSSNQPYFWEKKTFLLLLIEIFMISWEGLSGCVNLRKK
jgi:hypothetical protein